MDAKHLTPGSANIIKLHCFTPAVPIQHAAPTHEESKMWAMPISPSTGKERNSFCELTGTPPAVAVTFTAAVWRFMF